MVGMQRPKSGCTLIDCGLAFAETDATAMSMARVEVLTSMVTGGNAESARGKKVPTVQKVEMWKESLAREKNVIWPASGSKGMNRKNNKYGRVRGKNNSMYQRLDQVLEVSLIHIIADYADGWHAKCLFRN